VERPTRYRVVVLTSFPNCISTCLRPALPFNYVFRQTATYQILAARYPLVDAGRLPRSVCNS